MTAKNRINIYTIDISLKGGIERVISNLSNEFIQNNEVVIYSFFRTNNFLSYSFDDQIKIKYLSNNRFNYFSYKIYLIFILLKNCSYLRSKSNDINISFYPILSVLFIGILRFKENQIIASEHSEYMSQSFLLRILRIIAYKRIYKIVTLTKSGVQNFANYKIVARTIPNSVTEFKTKSQWENKSSFQEANCIFVGRIEYVKQPKHFILLAKSFENADYIINFQMIGDGPLINNMKYYVNKLKLKNINFLGNIKAIYNEYSKGHFLIVTSKTEAFPMVVIEAMSFGCVVIGYECQVGTTEIIENGVSGFIVESGNIFEIKKLLIDLISDQEKYLAISMNAIKRAKRYRINEISKEWEKLLK